MNVNCPAHQVALIKKPIFYGMPDISANLDKYILGGCIVKPDNPTHGYECPIDHAVYLLNQHGNLIHQPTDGE